MKKIILFVLIFCGIVSFADMAQAVSMTGPQGTVYVGNSWSVYVIGLDIGETIYATGGKIINGSVPTDKTPYGPSIEYRGVIYYTTYGTFTEDQIGDWQLKWTRESGEVIGTSNFKVVASSGSDSAGSGTNWYSDTSSGPKVTDCNLWKAYDPTKYVYTSSEALTSVGVNAYGGDPYVASRWTRFDINQTTALQNINAYQQARNDALKKWVNAIVSALKSKGYNPSISWTSSESTSGFVSPTSASINIPGINNIFSSLGFNQYDSWTKNFLDPVAVLLSGQESEARISGQPPSSCTNTFLGNTGSYWWSSGTSGSGSSGSASSASGSTSLGTTINITDLSSLSSQTDASAYVNSVLAVVNNLVAKYKSMLNSSGVSQTAQTPATADQVSYVQNITEVVNNLTLTYKNMLASSGGSKTNAVANQIENAETNSAASGSISGQTGTSFIIPVTLTANGKTYLEVSPGQTINYFWISPVFGVNQSYSSYYTADKADTCSGGVSHAGEIKPWVAKTTSGSSLATVQNCQAGRTYTITFTAGNSLGKGSASITIKVLPLSLPGDISTTIIPPSLEPEVPEPLSSQIGVYFWDGVVNNAAPFLQSGQSLLTDLGADTIRIAMSSLSDQNYHIGGCISNFSLTGLASRQDFKSLLSNPQFKTIMITAYDGVSFPGCAIKNYLNPDFFTSANIALVKAEYDSFAKYLSVNFPTKTFIISHWEGDNDVFCGAAYGFVPNTGCTSYQKNLDGLKKWIEVRNEAISSSGAGNVFSAVEFNIVNNLHDRGLPSVLYDIAPTSNADFYSYSSYESINSYYISDIAKQLRYDVEKIKSIVGKPTSRIIIGEYGFGHTDRNKNRQELETITNTISEMKIPYAFIWNLLDAGGTFGLYDSSGTRTQSGEYMDTILAD